MMTNPAATYGGKTMSTPNENERLSDSLESSQSSDTLRDDELSQDDLGDVAGGAVRSDSSDRWLGADRGSDLGADSSSLSGADRLSDATGGSGGSKAG